MRATTRCLIEARYLVEQGWTRSGAIGITKFGREVSLEELRDPLGPTARYCSVGAIYASSKSTKTLLKSLQTFRESIGTPDDYTWNDSQKSKRIVLEAFDRSVELSK